MDDRQGGNVMGGDTYMGIILFMADDRVLFCIIQNLSRISQFLSNCKIISSNSKGPCHVLGWSVRTISKTSAQHGETTLWDTYIASNRIPLLHFCSPSCLHLMANRVLSHSSRVRRTFSLAGLFSRGRQPASVGQSAPKGRCHPCRPRRRYCSKFAKRRFATTKRPSTNTRSKSHTRSARHAIVQEFKCEYRSHAQG